MATRKSQRIGIWVIAIALTIGTLGSFAVMVLATQNSAQTQARLKELSTQYKKATDEYQAKLDAQAAELSKHYFAEFSQYAGRPGMFERDGVKTLASEDLKTGDGTALGKDATFAAYYIGWTPNGKVFDSSIKDGALKAPITAAPGGVIKGWTKGVEGMKVGGVREITIPSDDAYGEQGQGDTIPPNTPLKFVIMVVPTPPTIPQPEVPKELMDYYKAGVQ